MIELRERTEAHVRTYYEKTQDDHIKAMLPSAADTLEDALRMFCESQQPDAASTGRTIYADGRYVGDIWCYGLGSMEPDAMLSYCIFEKALWGRGIATQAVGLFLDWLLERQPIQTVGAFTYCDNLPSQKVLTANGFVLMETFAEDGRESAYYQKAIKRNASQP